MIKPPKSSRLVDENKRNLTEFLSISVIISLFLLVDAYNKPRWPLVIKSCGP